MLADIQILAFRGLKFEAKEEKTVSKALQATEYGVNNVPDHS